MLDPSSPRAATLRSRPPSARSFVSPPACSEPYPYTIRQHDVNDKAIKYYIPEPTTPHKGLRLKTIKQKPFGGGSFSTTSPNSKLLPASSSPISRPKAATVSSRPASQASKRSTIRGQISRNITLLAQLAPLAQTQASSGKKLGPENWTPITAAKVITSTPPPRLKVQKHRRGTILPEVGTTPLFSPMQSPPNQKYKDVFCNTECNSPPFVSQAPSRSLSPWTSPAKLPAKDSSPKPASELRRTRSALSLPSRHLKRRARTVSKTVTWDPSIVWVGPEARSNSRDSPEEDQKEVQINGAPDQVPTHKLDVKDCVEKIREWGKADRSKLVSLIEALKQLALDSEDSGRDDGNAKSNNDYDKGILITTVKSLDPRVPEFQLSRVVDAKNKTDRGEEPERHRPAELDLNLFLEPDYNKENIPEVPLQTPAKPRDNGVSTGKKRMIAILDDYNSLGREVDSFDHWYGEMQLREFAKKYPLTGRRASAVRQYANISAKIAKASEDVRSVSGGSEVVAADVRGGIRRSESVSDARDVEKRGRGEKRDAVDKNGREDDYAGRKHVRHRRRDMPPTDPSVRKNAAIIQQKLEVLLLKEKERKALEGMPEKAKTPVRKVDCGIWLWGESPHSGGLDCEASNSGLLWVPSERLRL
jgi:hypothetical protein